MSCFVSCRNNILYVFLSLFPLFFLYFLSFYQHEAVTYIKHEICTSFVFISSDAQRFDRALVAPVEIVLLFSFHFHTFPVFFTSPKS